MTPLHQFGEWLRSVFLQVPMPVVRLLFLLFLGAILLWILFSPREQVTAADRPYRLSENLRLWAALAIGIQVLVYLIF